MEIQKYKSPIEFKRYELDKATANYSLELGRGAFGPVYHGVSTDSELDSEQDSELDSDQDSELDCELDHELFLMDIPKISSHLTTAVAGTFGYLDPEYALSSPLRVGSDIYSFGMTVLNIVSGKNATELTDDLFLSAHAWRLCEEERLHELIDPRLFNTDGLINSSSITRTIITALWCTLDKSGRRPSASRVIAMLLSEEEIPIPRQAYRYRNLNG
ncbi:hypothetical protein SUGI_0701190 [Cryptomeria japonica]|nr:hypothetical protein SUGI_0701190 [Cryptomeria japonica]